ncbi:MAG: cytochrome c peroxidase [bacterium]|jgi:cytochrome c peroxidase
MKLHRIFFAFVLCITLPLVASAKGDSDMDLPLKALGEVPIPLDNKQSPEKIKLGKMLFWDGRLGGNGSTSCAACHAPEQGWGYNSKISRGYPGTVHWRNSNTIINSAYYAKLFWAGSSKSLEKQAKSAAKGGVAGNGESDVMEAKLALIPEYRKMFNKVFGHGLPKLANAWAAIAAFERTLVQRDTPFDRYMNGDKSALKPNELKGKALFEGKANCIECHNGALTSDQKYYNNGVPTNKQWQTSGLAQITFRYEIFAKGVTLAKYRKTKNDLGYYFRTKENSDKGKFRTPSLRYVKYTAPYMHNGSLATLDDVIEFYNKGGGKDVFGTKTKILEPLGLSMEEKSDLKAFILTLSGKEIRMNPPKLPEMKSLSYFPVK